jgi:hypothetical protein
MTNFLLRINICDNSYGCIFSEISFRFTILYRQNLAEPKHVWVNENSPKFRFLHEIKNSISGQPSKKCLCIDIRFMNLKVERDS